MTPILELSDKDLKITMKNMLKNLLGKINTMGENMRSCWRYMETEKEPNGNSRTEKYNI